MLYSLRFETYEDLHGCQVFALPTDTGDAFETRDDLHRCQVLIILHCCLFLLRPLHLYTGVREKAGRQPPLTGVKKEKNDISKNVKQFRQQSCGGLSRITIFSKEVMLWLK